MSEFKAGDRVRLKPNDACADEFPADAYTVSCVSYEMDEWWLGFVELGESSTQWSAHRFEAVRESGHWERISQPHYERLGAIQPIDVIEAWHLPHHLACVVKYLARAGHKGDEVQDLDKALGYLERYRDMRKAAVK